MMVMDTSIRPTEPAHGKKVYGIFAMLFILALTAWVGTIQWKDHLTVSGIIVEGQHIVTKEEVVASHMFR